MKLILGLLVIIGVAFFSREAWFALSEKKVAKLQTQFEQSLFPVIVQAQPQEFIFARPMYVIETATTLTVYCEYLGEKSVEAREQLRNEMVLVVKKWTENQPTNYQFIYVTFTDEVIAPEKK